MYKWYEHSEIYANRSKVEEQLELPGEQKSEDERATAFWARVEKAGLLTEALTLYDQVAAEYAAWRHVRRETKEEFAQRIEREGRQAAAGRLRAELLASGLSQREAQVELVARLQPLDGSETRAWETPDPWEAGRLFRKRADQKAIMALVNKDEEEEKQVREAEWRVKCAQLRREERLALAAARRRAQALQAHAPA